MSKSLSRAKPVAPSPDSKFWLAQKFITYEENPLKLHERVGRSIGGLGLAGALGLGFAVDHSPNEAVETAADYIVEQLQNSI